MDKKIKVGLIFGGQSPEHEVSKMTAKSILENIDRNFFDVTEIYIDKDGGFDENLLCNIDVAFLAVHGPNCEDGKLQKMLEDKGIKYTGSGVAASRLNMDKIEMHEVFHNAGLSIVKFLGFDKTIGDAEIIKKTEKEIGYPCFIKPNNTGSSIGISKATNIHELRQGMQKAFKCDEKIIVEEAVANPREIEVAILGNDNLMISEPGEIDSNGEFYSYETKYFKPFNTKMETELSEEKKRELKNLAEKAYKVTSCRGYSRIDFLIDKDEEIYINEINTLPGFTKISMFPKLMGEAGIPYKNLITKIINLALE